MKKTLQYLLFALITLGCQPVFAQTSESQKEKPVYGVEQMPQFPGGDEALMKFVRDNLKYPMKAAESGVEGRVTIRFVVGSTGEVTDVTVIRGLEPSCDAEAVRVVKMMPTWIPGRTNGRNVPVYYTIPIVYKLQKRVEDNSPLLIIDGTPRPYSMLRDTLQLNPADIASATVLKDSAAIKMYGQKGKNGVVLITTKAEAAKKQSTVAEDIPIYEAEVMPQFPGGELALMDFIKRNLRYPTSEAQRGVEGRTMIRFVVNKLGKITDVKVIRGISPGCDAEAIRVVKMMPDWKPGTVKGKPASVYYTLPFVFKLQR